MATGNIDQQDAMLSFDDLDSQDELDDSSMSLVEHLEELRWRIIKSLAAIVVGAIISFIFINQIFTFLTAPLPNAADVLGKGHQKLVVTGLMEGITVYLLVALVAGVILALPVILYQAWAFIAPGLYTHEKKHAVPFIGIGVGLFLLGVTVAYIVIRYPVEWLVTFASGSFTELISASSYLNFVALFILLFGVVFELPLVLTFLAIVDLISIDTLRRKRAAAHIGMWMAATLVTPGADFYSPIFLGVSMSFLYELSIIFIRFFVKKDATTA